MQIISYRTSPGDPWKAGFEENGRVLAATAAHDFAAIVPGVRSLLEAGPASLARALEGARGLFLSGAATLLALDEIIVGPPVPNPDKIICLGRNYEDHVAETSASVPVHPVLFAKFRNSLIGPHDAILLPRFSTQIDYEVELAVVIGQKCKEVSAKDALQYVAGYTIMDDVSARDWQYHTGQWMPGKAVDTFAPMGPGIVPAADIPDPQQLKLTTHLNGQLMQDASTSQMIFSVAQSIEYISTVMTLLPGDIISTGTPAGVGHAHNPPVFLHAGDHLVLEIERIGRLENQIRSIQDVE